ncbi:MAG: hypothetical protein AAGC43_11295 [Bacteroidota bacterium]
MKREVFSIVLIINCFLISCAGNEVFDEDKARKEIYELHNAQRKYHFEKDSVSFVNQLSSNYMEVSKGIVATPKLEDKLSRYHRYFSQVEFLKWDDLQEPTIRFSEDGSLAYTIVDKIVQVSYQDENGNETTGETHFAWVAIYRKTREGWNIECAISTNEPISNNE